jgi:hypothetical protein
MNNDDNQCIDTQVPEADYCVARFDAVMEDLLREGASPVAIEIALGEMAIRAACKDPVTAASSPQSIARMLDAAVDAAHEWLADDPAPSRKTGQAL